MISPELCYRNEGPVVYITPRKSPLSSLLPTALYPPYSTTRQPNSPLLPPNCIPLTSPRIYTPEASQKKERKKMQLSRILSMTFYSFLTILSVQRTSSAMAKNCMSCVLVYNSGKLDTNHCPGDLKTKITRCLDRLCG